MNSSNLRSSWQTAASSSSRQSFSTSAISRHRSLPRPRAIRPASQKNTSVPSNVLELVTAYPKHPLLAFFRREERKVKESPDSTDEKEVIVPVTISQADLRTDSNSRGWMAPELRTKSSLELHQLWYKCLMERNKIRTTADELQRTGARQLAQMANYNGFDVERRIRKTMARTKFVLNERRLALLEARRRSAIKYKERDAADLKVEEEEGSLYEELKDI